MSEERDYSTAVALWDMQHEADARAKEKQNDEDAITKGLRDMLQAEAEAKKPKTITRAPAPAAEPPIPSHIDPWERDDDTRAFLQFLGQP